MRNFKKIASFAIAAVMTLGLLAPISTSVAKAADATITVDSNDVHTYTAYQIIAGDFEEVDGELVITESATYGENVDSAKLIDALGLEEDATIVDVAAKLESMTAAEIVEALKTEGVLTGDATVLSNGNNTVAQGYYYIVDSYDEETADILKVADTTVEIAPKLTDDATVDKQVSTGEGTWGEATSAEAGDAVGFKVCVTLPSNLGNYETFYFYLEDTLKGSLTFVENSLNASYAVVDADGTEHAITGGLTATVDDDKNVTFNCDDVDEITTEDNYVIKGGDTIVVYYSAIFAADGNVNVADNTNTVTLHYVNDPDTDGDGILDSKDDDDDNDGIPDDEDDDADGDGKKDGDADEDGIPDDEDDDDDNDGVKDDEDTDDDGDGTPDDEENDDEYIVTEPVVVVVVSYTLNITKVDSEDSTVKLEGAQFQIKNADGDYAVCENGVITGWTSNAAEASTFTTDANGAFVVAGLGTGTYTLVETKAPVGYNGAGSEFELTIEAGFEDGELVDLTIQAGNGEAEEGDVTNAAVSTTITNTKGSTLPSTGSIGTVIFSVVGGALVIGAAVLLITKKRANSEEI